MMMALIDNNIILMIGQGHPLLPLLISPPDQEVDVDCCQMCYDPVSLERQTR